MYTRTDNAGVGARQTHKAEERVGRWKGTLADVFELARAAERFVAQEAKGEELSVYVLVAQPGFDSGFEDLASFEQGVTDADIPNITRIRVSISYRQAFVEAGQIGVDMFRRSGANLDVTGSNPTWVRGASGEMRELLERGHRKWAERLDKTVWIVGVVLVVGLGIAGTVGRDHVRAWPLAARLVFSSFFILGGLGVLWPLVAENVLSGVVLVPATGSRPLRSWILLRRFATWAATILLTVLATVWLTRVLGD